MISFKNFLTEANLGNSPDNYPPGSIILLNKGKTLGHYKERESFTVLEISKVERNYDYDLNPNGKSILFITLSDSTNKVFTIKISKSNANSYFLKGKKLHATHNILFTNKELSPDNLMLSGLTLTADQILVHLKSHLNYSNSINNLLLDMAKVSNAKGDVLSIDASEMNLSEFATISKDYGEILGAIWIMKNLNFRTVTFPKSSNEPLIDFYANRFGVAYPFSIKSGSGSKVTIDNILKLIEHKANQQGFKEQFADEELDSIQVLKRINELPMRDGMVEAHKILNTSGIQELSKVIGIPVSELTNTNITSWLDELPLDEIQSKLEKFYIDLNSRPADKMWTSNREKNRLIIAPLGESLHKMLNVMPEMQSALNKMSRMNTIIQLNVDVTDKKITFKTSKFKNSKFKFGWAGYSAGNKLGFKLV